MSYASGPKSIAGHSFRPAKTSSNIPENMAANAPAAVANSTVSRRRWWQFSLLNLLLVAVIVCVTAAYYGSRQELEQAKREVASTQQEIKELRDQIGILDVSDESKIYLRARKSLFDQDPFHWRWRVHLPKLPAGLNWHFDYRVGKVESKGFDVRGGGGGGSNLEGQFDLDATFERHLDGSAWLSVRAHGTRRGFETNVRVSEEDAQSLQRLGDRGAKVAGRKLVVASADERLELLRIVSTEKPGEQSGLLIFLERHMPPDKSNGKKD
jgi:cell division protein FtsL